MSPARHASPIAIGADEILHRLEQELDVEATRIGVGEARPG
jgi:hypothetical protein